MYCIKCGVELTDGQEVCPLCQTKVYHPDLPLKKDSPAYPQKELPSEEFNPRGVLFVISVLAFLVLALPIGYELFSDGRLDWSGYVAGGVILLYLLAVLPFWFRRANPTVFIPCDFAAIEVFLLYIDLQTRGGWFLSFAFPVVGVLALIVTAIVALCRYVRRGYLYIVGGGLIAFGGWTMLLEMFLHITFAVSYPVLWSPFTCATFLLLGMMLIVIAIVKPLRESLRRIFFVG